MKIVSKNKILLIVFVLVVTMLLITFKSVFFKKEECFIKSSNGCVQKYEHGSQQILDNYFSKKLNIINDTTKKEIKEIMNDFVSVNISINTNLETILAEARYHIRVADVVETKITVKDSDLNYADIKDYFLKNTDKFIEVKKSKVVFFTQENVDGWKDVSGYHVDSYINEAYKPTKYIYKYYKIPVTGTNTVEEITEKLKKNDVSLSKYINEVNIVKPNDYIVKNLKKSEIFINETKLKKVVYSLISKKLNSALITDKFKESVRHQIMHERKCIIADNLKDKIFELNKQKEGKDISKLVSSLFKKLKPNIIKINNQDEFVVKEVGGDQKKEIIQNAFSDNANKDTIFMSTDGLCNFVIYQIEPLNKGKIISLEDDFLEVKDVYKDYLGEKQAKDVSKNILSQMNNNTFENLNDGFNIKIEKIIANDYIGKDYFYDKIFQSKSKDVNIYYDNKTGLLRASILKDIIPGRQPKKDDTDEIYSKSITGGVQNAFFKELAAGF